MKRTIRLTAALAALATAGALTALTLSPAAAADWDWQSLPSGYFVSSYATCYDDQGVNHEPACGTVPVCNHVSIQTATSGPGAFAEADCTDTFQADLNGFVQSTICQVNPGADPGDCAPTTSTAATSTEATTTTETTTAASTTTATTTTSSQVTTTAVLAQTVTVTTPAYTDTVTVPTYVTSSDTTDEISLINQRLDELEGRVQALEDQVGLIIGEEKNEPPFTDPA